MFDYIMVKTFKEFENEIAINESDQRLINEAADKIAEMIKNGDEIDESIFDAILGGAAGYAFGPSIGTAICKALGVTSGLLYNLLTSKAFTTAVAAYMGYKH